MKFITQCRSCNSNVFNTRPAILAPFITERIFGMKPETTTSLYGIPNQVNYFPCKTMTCETCRFVGVNISFDDEEMSKIYHGYRGVEYNKVRLSYEPTYQNQCFNERHIYVDEISEPFILDNVSNVETLIDFGGYNGLNTPRVGTNRYVYDICNIESCIPVIDKLFNCDLITCMHVLEHVHNPILIIEQIKGWAKYYYFEVPNENTENKEFWHEHINCFSMKSFHNLLSKHFKIIAKKEDKFLHILCENL